MPNGGGHEVARCPNCSSPVGYETKFCGKCGIQLNWLGQQKIQQPAGKVRATFGWVLFIIGCLALLNSLILLNFLMNWTPSWFISAALIGCGAWLLRLKVGGVFGVLFGLLSVAGLVYCITTHSIQGILGIILFAFLAWILLRKGLLK